MYTLWTFFCCGKAGLSEHTTTPSVRTARKAFFVMPCTWSTSSAWCSSIPELPLPMRHAAPINMNTSAEPSVVYHEGDGPPMFDERAGRRSSCVNSWMLIKPPRTILQPAQQHRKRAGAKNEQR